MKVVIWLALLALASGCVTNQANSPESVLQAYRDALARKDYDTAYKLMSSDFKTGVSREQFAAMMRENKKLVTSTHKELADFKEVKVIAEYEYGLGEVLRFERDKGRWWLVSNPIDYYADETPRQAIRSFVRAYKHKRWDVMHSFVTRRYKTQMTPKQIEQQFTGKFSERLAEQMKALEANLNEPIREEATSAMMTYGGVYEIRLELEEGGWKVKDL